MRYIRCDTSRCAMLGRLLWIPATGELLILSGLSPGGALHWRSSRSVHLQRRANYLLNSMNAFFLAHSSSANRGWPWVARSPLHTHPQKFHPSLVSITENCRPTRGLVVTKGEWLPEIRTIPSPQLPYNHLHTQISKAASTFPWVDVSAKNRATNTLLSPYHTFTATKLTPEFNALCPRPKFENRARFSLLHTRIVEFPQPTLTL